MNFRYITNDIKSLEEEYEKFVGFKENKRSLSQYKNICVELNNKMGSTLEIVDKITNVKRHVKLCIATR